MQRILEAAGVRVWRDTLDLRPGDEWPAVITQAIASETLVFMACFSRNSVARRRGYQYEELTQAIGQLRARCPGSRWIVPVRFDDCSILDLAVGAGRSLASIQCADLFGDRYGENVAQLIASVLQAVRQKDGWIAVGSQPDAAEDLPNPDGVDSAAEFRVRLRQLWVRAGAFPKEFSSPAAENTLFRVVLDVLPGRRMPTWEELDALLAACALAMPARTQWQETWAELTLRPGPAVKTADDDRAGSADAPDPAWMTGMAHLAEEHQAEVGDEGDTGSTSGIELAWAEEDDVGSTGGIDLRWSGGENTRVAAGGIGSTWDAGDDASVTGEFERKRDDEDHGRSTGDFAIRRSAARLIEDPARWRAERQIVLWGAPASGKSCFLAALNMAAARDGRNWTLVGQNPASAETLRQMTKTLIRRELAEPTIGIEHNQFVLSGDISVENQPRWFQLKIDIIDPAGGIFRNTVHRILISIS